MSHHPQPFFKKSRSAWYVEINRRQIKLGSDREKAFQLYHQLMAQPRQPPVSSDLVVTLIDVFLEWVQKNRAPETYEWYRYRLQRFSEKYPDLRAMSLRPYRVEQWVDSYPKMAVTSRRNYLRSVKRCVSWAVRQGYLDHNSIAALEIPGGERREVYVTPAQFAEILEYSTDSGFSELLHVTYLCGCRPQESLIVTAEYYDAQHSRWVIPQSKGQESSAYCLSDRACEGYRPKTCGEFPYRSVVPQLVRKSLDYGCRELRVRSYSNSNGKSKDESIARSGFGIGYQQKD